MKSKKLRYLLTAIVVLSVGWLALTFYVEMNGPSKEWSFGNTEGKKVLIVFDPDPFYNLDQQLCLTFGKALADKEMFVKIVTVAAADNVNQNEYDALVFCANTYNWTPDWSITSHIKDHPPRESQSVVAITIGAGSTESSQARFEKVITSAGGKIQQSYSSWLWRPNDESRGAESNVDVAVAMAYAWGSRLADQLNK